MGKIRDKTYAYANIISLKILYEKTLKGKTHERKEFNVMLTRSIFKRYSP
jgi:hypothetical protein